MSVYTFMSKKIIPRGVHRYNAMAYSLMALRTSRTNVERPEALRVMTVLTFGYPSP